MKGASTFMAKAGPVIEETKHYGGEATVKFYVNAHYYAIDDPKHPDGPLVGARMGGGTSLTGTMAKGQGLMMYPMYEAIKHLRAYFKQTTVEEFVNEDFTIQDLFDQATKAHVKKSDRGKSVGTDAHAWVEDYLKRLHASQNGGPEFVAPEIKAVEDIALILRRRYIEIANDLKPQSLDDYRRLPKLILQDIDIQESLWIEATMLHQSIEAAKQWLDLHDIKVHGVEGTVYSRKMRVCGKFDSDISVTCTEKCGWCYRNGNPDLPEKDYTGRYMTDFKSTNASTEAPKGIYKEYLAQCGVYVEALLEEFPDRHYDGSLILNGSKQNGTFSTHFSFNLERDREWARTLVKLRDFLYESGQEIKASL